MRRLVGFAMGIVMTAMGATARADDDLPADLRVLLIFSRPDDPALTVQKTLLDSVAAEEMRERDLVVLHVPPSGNAIVLFGPTRQAYSAASLRKKRDVESGTEFTALLVGKDGGTKWRETRPVRPEELFRLIDSMPMRALERKRNRSAD